MASSGQRGSGLSQLSVFSCESSLKQKQLTAALQNHLALQFLNGPFSRCRTPTALGATSKVGRGKRCPNTPHTEHAPPGEYQRKNRPVPEAPLGEIECLIISSHAWRNPMRSSERGRAESGSYWQEVSRKTLVEGTGITQEVFIEAMWKRF